MRHPTRDLAAARRAFDQMDPEMSRLAHGGSGSGSGNGHAGGNGQTIGSSDSIAVAAAASNPPTEEVDGILVEGAPPAQPLGIRALLAAKEHHGRSRRYIKSIVYGGLDGIITTFAVVAAVAGGSVATSVVLILGFANIFADGFSMGFGDFLSTKAEIDFNRTERKREKWECENYLEGEKREMIEIYMSKGLSETDATTIVDILAKDLNVFVDVMMVEELGIMPEDEKENPLKNGVVTFVSFLVFGCVPLLAYIGTGGLNQWLYSIIHVHIDIVFIMACLLTVCTLFTLGAFKGKLTGKRWWVSGILMILNGGFAAALSYLIGWTVSLIQDFIDNHFAS